jgi:hypothetical protein
MRQQGRLSPCKCAYVDMERKVACPTPFYVSRAYNMHSGFPPLDGDLRRWFEEQALASEHAVVMKRLHNFTYSLLTVLLDHLKDIESKELLEEAKSGKCSEYPIIRSRTTR